MSSTIRLANLGLLEFVARMKVNVLRCRMAGLVALLGVPMLAIGVEVGPLPECGFADTEASTNVAFVVDREQMLRGVFELSLVATPSNNVEVSVGCDANGDGRLAVDEADSAYVQPGWIVAHHGPPRESGHVGIVDFDGAGIAAGFGFVNRAAPEFISGPCVYSKLSLQEENSDAL